MRHSKEILRCPVSGVTDHISRCRPMEPEENAEEFELACQEWIFGIPRGSLSFHMQSWENNLCFRKDICRMYCEAQFILAPTFRTYIDAMAFMRQRAGVTARKETDESPRRPWTALAPNGGPYRYVFIPFTDAARELQKKYKMQPQTDDDLNNRWHPLLKIDLLEGSGQYPVVECYAHPFSVSTWARKAFALHSPTEMNAQWRVCAAEIVDQWRLEQITPPKWFVDAPKFEMDDTDLSATEASGYDPSASEEASLPEATRTLGDAHATVDAADPRTKVSAWLRRVDLKAKPFEQESPRSPRKLRRSTRLAALSSPYASSSPEFHAPLSPIRRAPWPSARGRDPIRYTPAWAKRNGRFPTPRFSSNDWAYFQYGVALAARARA
ncbi:hypothetical protein BD626DRAFT_84625 [Schizophyllum amplum]|uniref:Uncharacterized protein n=1 Tax=Schizophyllum amplum TaxID=97359 RepID=A0A550C915_9AGAR|nr:hypothetical protein BD626DRAFT_84625 [Auriculariopsis ampla]